MKQEQRRTVGSWITSIRAKYDSYGRVIQTTDPVGTNTDYFYESTHNLFPVRTADPVGTTHASFHALTGQASDECGPQFSGTTWSCRRTEIDRHGRPTATWAPKISPSGTFEQVKLSTTTYDDVSYPSRECTNTRPADPDYGRRCVYRDGFGNITQSRVLTDDAGMYRVTAMSYEAAGAPVRAELPWLASSDAYSHAPPTPDATTFVYDYVRNELEAVRQPATSAAETWRTLAAPGMAPIIEHIDEDGVTEVYTLDGFAAPEWIRREGGSSDDSFTHLAYNNRHEFESIVDPNGLLTVFTRNELGWVTTQVDPGGATTQYSYNDRGQVSRVQDPRNVVVDFTYDVAGRLTRLLSSNEPAGVRRVDATVTYYGATTPRQLGRPASESSDSISNLYGYDAEGNLVEHSVTMGVHSGTVKFERALGGRVTTVRYNEELGVGYQYTRDDAVKSLVNLEDGRALATYEFEDDGQPSLVYNDYGVDTSYRYDVQRRLTSIVTTLPDALPIDDELTWSDGSRLVQVRRRGDRGIGHPRAAVEIQNIGRDRFGRITSVSRDGGEFGSYAYDVGDRIQSFHDGVVSGPSTSLYQFDKLLQRTTGASVTTYLYDAAGNVVHDQRTTDGSFAKSKSHQWDALSRLANTASLPGGATTYYYTPSGELARVVRPGAQPSNIDQLFIGPWARKDMSSNTWRYRALVGDEAIAEIEGEDVELLHRTHAGTVSSVSDREGNVLRQQEFTPFGASLSDSLDGSLVEDGYHGLRTDELIVTGARVYDPERGSWLSRDPLREVAPERLLADTRLTAFYSFAFNDPFTYRDPSGFDPDDEKMGIEKKVPSPSGSNRPQPPPLPVDVRVSPLNPENLKNNLAWQTANLVATTGEVTFEAATWIFPQLDVLRYAARGDWGNAIFAAGTSMLPLGKIIAKGARRLATFLEKTSGATSRALLFPAGQLQSKYKHAADFGLTGNWSKSNGYVFSQALNQHINSPGIKVIKGRYHRKPVIHYLDPTTGVNVITDRKGNFISGWKLSPMKLYWLRKTGSI